MLIDNNLRHKINKLVEEVKSTLGDLGQVRIHGSAKDLLKKRSGRYRDVDLKWSREEVNYGMSKGMKYSTSFNVNNKKYNITVIGRITELGVEGAEVIFSLDEHEGKNNVTTLTGTGDSFKVMSTILNSLIKLANDRKEIQSVWWSSNDNNKTPLFKRLSKMVPAGLDFECSYSSKRMGGTERITFNRISKKRDKTDVDVQVVVNPKDIKSTYLKIVSIVEDRIKPKEYYYKCGFHPYIYSKKYTKTGISLLNLDKKIQERIYQILECDIDGHNVIKSILCRELDLRWSKSDLNRGYISFKGDIIDLEDAAKLTNPDCIILKNRRYLIEAEINSDITLDFSIQSEENIRLTSTDYMTEKYNARLEELLLYGEYYKMFKNMKRFLNCIFLVGMYRKNYFNKSQYYYLKHCYENTFNNNDNTIINNHDAMDTVIKLYGEWVKLKIFKNYGRKN